MLNLPTHKNFLNFAGKNQTDKKNLYFGHFADKKNSDIQKGGSNLSINDGAFCGISEGHFDSFKKMSFKGCYPKYKDLETGIKVIPVFGHINVRQLATMMARSLMFAGKRIISVTGSRIVSGSGSVDIKDFLNILKEFVTSSLFLGAGSAGSVRSLDENYVLKIFHKGCEKYGAKETAVWDSFYETGTDVTGFPAAQTAFKIPGGRYLLVSKKIPGTHPSAKRKFNEKNLKDLMQQICRLDYPEICQDETNNLFYRIRIHNDIHRHNINITDENAGILDFEFLKYVRSDRGVSDGVPDTTDLNIMFSDNGVLPSNLETFELRSFVPYLFDLYEYGQNSEEIKNIFEIYLRLKSLYHKSISKYLSMQTPVINDKKYLRSNNAEDFQNFHSGFISSEYGHFMALNANNPCVVMAETVKMQLSHFLYVMSPVFGQNRGKINLPQIKAYLENAEEFFTSMQESSSPWKIYWNSCLRFLENCKNLHESFIQCLDTPADYDRITVFLNGLRLSKKMSLDEIEKWRLKKLSDKDDLVLKVRFMPDDQPGFCLKMPLEGILSQREMYEEFQKKKTAVKTVTLTEILNSPQRHKSRGT